ncbi:cysteine-rich CWC family protein [Aliagarivorans marinus]|uniref:cysteine-rich CWC family protein n=1 Tax=Aliagarivorans marinus TaxID=561965 RepID=UPI0003FE7228|nr:cysteine-rich CWC family protein [Aliagarivorans marinus]
MSKRCPLCKQDNHCQVESGACWCMQRTIPLDLLSLLPEEQRGVACICPNCVTAFEQDSKAFIESLELDA